MGTVGHFTLRHDFSKVSAGSAVCTRHVSTSYQHVAACAIRTRRSSGRQPRRLASVVVNVAEVRPPLPASLSQNLLSCRVMAAPNCCAECMLRFCFVEWEASRFKTTDGFAQVLSSSVQHHMLRPRRSLLVDRCRQQKWPSFRRSSCSMAISVCKPRC